MGEAATERSSVPNCKMRHVRHGNIQNGKLIVNRGGGFDVIVPRQCADEQSAAISFLYSPQFFNIIDIDKCVGVQQPKVKHWYKALPASDKFRVTATGNKRSDSIVHAFCANVIKRWRFHCAGSLALPVLNASKPKCFTHAFGKAPFGEVLGFALPLFWLPVIVNNI